MNMRGGAVSEVVIEYVDLDQLKSRREALIRQSGLNLEELRARAAVWAITPEQRDILEELDDVDYLLEA